YDDWRSQVLAGDAGVANLSWVARADHERGRDQAAGALLRVAAWVAMTEGTRERAQGELVDATAKDLGVALTAARPDEATLAAAGVSLLADEWRPLPHLLASRREQLGDGQLGAHVRRMVGLDRDGAPVLLHAGIGAAEDGDLRVLLDVDRRARTRRSTSDLEQGAVGTELDGGRLELRRAHDRYEVRWLRPGR
ncbi:MAG: hypothetical protein KAI24_20100, partial [Planctomycetes bacterium]|nr:hypothetical protein [Planctomycetota bacterium]